MLALIVAKSKNNVIGFNGKMPWRQKNDLQRFKALTHGHTVIMGSKTYAAIGNKPLAGRKNVIISRRPAGEFTGLHTKGERISVQSDLNQVTRDYYVGHDSPGWMDFETAFIIGGAEIYRQAIQDVDKLFITELDCEVEGDSTFPDIDLDIWEKIAEEKYTADSDNEYNYTFVTYSRRKP